VTRSEERDPTILLLSLMEQRGMITCSPA
jgi:hypothetical protein